MTARARPLSLAWRGGPRLWLDLLRAAFALARARRLLGRRPPAELLRLARAPAGRPAPSGAEDLARRVAFAVPRVAARVPWRADCFVQALAAQAWLAREGVETDLFVGVRTEGGFAAHAWLRHGDLVVTGGGGLDGYVPLVTPGTPLP